MCFREMADCFLYSLYQYFILPEKLSGYPLEIFIPLFDLN
jgi:hypothetical protein